MDTTQPSVARAYDFALGGKDNFEVDRQFARAIKERDPEVFVTAQLNKDFGRRATEYMAKQGVRQFLDLGSGIPTSPPSIHDTARRFQPDARVVYVDNDPVVAAHNRALRAVSSGLALVQHTFLEPETIFAHPDFISTLDTSEPIGILFCSVLQNTPADTLADVLSRLRARLAPGSYLAISHTCERTSQAVKEAFAQQHETKGYPKTWFRSDAEITEFFAGFDIVEPGIVDYRDWYPDAELAANRPELNTQFTCGLGVLS